MANLAKVYSAELEGIDAKLIEVEVDINVGLHAFNIVGLADRALNEAKERVNSALKNSGIKPPNRENRKITTNLAPADVKKTGSQYDLAIAMGYLLATEQMRQFETRDKVFVGELALDGGMRPIGGALSIAQMAFELGFKYVFLPEQNADEASVIKDVDIIPVRSLREVIDFLEKRKDIAPARIRSGGKRPRIVGPDFSEIIGQENAKRALMIAAAGGHNVLMMGPPGVGKSFLARAFGGILPELTLEEAIEITKIWSAAGLNAGEILNARPFRAPHQTASVLALIGGGNEPKPGEISLAHRGVLFLDELPEFQKSALEALRQPMESGFLHLARAKRSLTFPTKFMLVAAMNPCPCGYYGDTRQACTCSAYEIVKYQKRVSGPLLDRIDIQIKVGRMNIGELRKEVPREVMSAEIKKRVDGTREMQVKRFTERGLRILTNAEMSSRQATLEAKLGVEAEKFLKTLDRSKLSARGYYRILKVARTIADLEGRHAVGPEDLAEAFSYRLREAQF